MRSPIRVSAPGKSILMGEHAAVYARPALVAAVDRRLTVELEEKEGAGVALDLPGIGVAETVAWPQLVEYARVARERWRAYEWDPGPETFERLRGDDPAHLVRVAFGETALRLGMEEGPAVTLRLDSQIPIGAGFGSSAAVAVAVARAVLAAVGLELADEELHRLTLEIERRQHGQPSGVDNATVIHGGLVWAHRDSDDRLVVEPVAVESSALRRMRVFHTGEPAESTGAVVSAVRSRYDAEPGRYGALLDRMEVATRGLRRAIEESDRSDRSGTTRTIVDLIREFEGCLERLGVVPEAVREIVRRVESRGGAAKISGAGALSGRGAGSLLVYHPRPEEIGGWEFLRDLTALDLRLGAPGVRVENEEPGS